MPYTIEIVATKSYLIEYLQRAIAPLNIVQQEVNFQIVNQRVLDQAYLYDRETYLSADVFEWMRNFKEQIGGNHPYMILVVDKELSGHLSNLYGNHDAKNGFAVFTTKSFDPQYEQFLFDIVRFCRYYCARYMLSFIHPGIKSHYATKACMFDKKKYKPDLLLSLSSGDLCPVCKEQLQTKYTPEIKSAIEAVLKVVSNQAPIALVMKGGGVKGLAFAGALSELGKYFTFNLFAGTSAGAIASVLLGAGYSPSELTNILENTDFNSFKDSGLIKRIINFKRKGGMHTGENFYVWINNLLRQKLKLTGRIELKDLPNRTIMYASRIGDGPLTFDSKGARKETLAAYATRCSMSLPLFFIPAKVDGINVYDGGLLNNFPLRIFLDQNRNKLFLGLYLESEIDDSGSLKSIATDLIPDSDERKMVDQYKDLVVKINPHPINTKEFSLSEEKKQFLVKCGRVGALNYLVEYHRDLQIDSDLVRQLNEELEQEREGLIIKSSINKFKINAMRFFKIEV